MNFFPYYPYSACKDNTWRAYYLRPMPTTYPSPIIQEIPGIPSVFYNWMRTPMIILSIAPQVIFNDETAGLSWQIENATRASMSESRHVTLLVPSSQISGTEFDGGGWGAGGTPDGGVAMTGSNIITGSLLGQGNYIYTISAHDNLQSTTVSKWLDILTIPNFKGNCTPSRISDIKNAIKTIDAALRNGCIICDCSLDATVSVFINKHIDKINLWERILAELQNMQLITFNCIDTNTDSQVGGRWIEHSNEIQLSWSPRLRPNYEYVILHELIHKSGLNSELLTKGYNKNEIEEHTFKITDSCF